MLYYGSYLISFRKVNCFKVMEVQSAGEVEALPPPQRVTWI